MEVNHWRSHVETQHAVCPHTWPSCQVAHSLSWRWCNLICTLITPWWANPYQGGDQGRRCQAWDYWDTWSSWPSQAIWSCLEELGKATVWCPNTWDKRVCLLWLCVNNPHWWCLTSKLVSRTHCVEQSCRGPLYSLCASQPLCWRTISCCFPPFSMMTYLITILKILPLTFN